MKLTAPEYTSEFISHCLNSSDESLALWGAFQRLGTVKQPGELVELLERPISVVQEAALSKLSSLESEEAQALVPLAVTLFRESNSHLKYQAAYCLSQFPSDFTNSLLSKWAKSCLVSDESTRFELEAAILSWLAVDPKATDALLDGLYDYQENPLLSSLLFRYLLPHCLDHDRFSRLVDFYFYTRDHHADLENTSLLMGHLADPELTEWVSQCMMRGNDLNQTYGQMCSLLGDVPLVRWQPYWKQMDRAGVRFDSLVPTPPINPQDLITGIKLWLEALPPTPSHPVALWLVEGFERNLEQFGSAIPRLIELEVKALLALVPSLVVTQCLDRWLLKPALYLEQIANFYHSPVSSSQHQDRILRFFFPTAPDWNVQQCLIQDTTPATLPQVSIGEILWRFFSGELLGQNLPWYTWFPNPSVNENLCVGLTKIYLANFDHWVAQGDHLNIDYGLQLFELLPSVQAMDLVDRHFDYLHRNHTDYFYQLIERCPDERMILRLNDIHRHGEYDLALLIGFLSEAFEQELPGSVKQDLEHQETLKRFGRKKPVRLKCQECGHSYQYFAEVLYIDEGDILRTGRLSSKSIWTPNPFHCKDCGAVLPLEFDEAQLEEFTLQSKADQILRQRLSQSGFGQRILLVEFPRYLTQSYNPDQFEELIKELEESKSLDADEMALIYLKASRMFKGLSRYHESLSSLVKLDPVPQKYALEAHFLKGVCLYRLRNFAQARPEFDEVIHFYGEQSEMPFLEESKSFLRSMSEDRQRFLVIEGRK